MGIKSTIAWYQNKIGHYDEQVWEKRIKHKNYYRFSPLDLKSANLKPGLIDLDLVRGSSFTKAKPKHGFLTVLRLATLRFWFYPFYLRWWILLTSWKVALVLLLVYIIQLCNIYLYYFKIQDTRLTGQYVPSTEVFVPFFMMWILCIIHSQIVATNPVPDKTKLKMKNRKIVKRKSSKFKLHSFDELLTHLPKSSSLTTKKLHNGSKVAVVDDGFESFNGNGTSNSETEINSSKIQEDNGNVEEDEDEELSNQELREKRRTRSLPARTKSRCHSTSSDERDSNSDTDVAPKVVFKRRNSFIPQSIYDVSDEDDIQVMNRVHLSSQSDDVIPDVVDCFGATTNSEEDCSYASDLEDFNNQCESTIDTVPSCINSSEKVSCMIWHITEIKEASLSVLDIIAAIIARVESVPESMDYLFFGIMLSTVISICPACCRLCDSTVDMSFNSEIQVTTVELFSLIKDKLSSSLIIIAEAAFGTTIWERTIMITAAMQRWILSFLFFFLLTVAERSYKQRFLYAKFFSHLTSSRRARKSELPHFRLNKVLNIKIWLATRSYLKKKGPQRSVDVIVSAAFIIAFLLFLFITVDMLACNIEAIIWCIGLAIWLLRFMTLGTQINRKYLNRNLSILTTEQINLHLQIEQNSLKKEELSVANSVLKLAADLLKDMESPFQILGLSANPYLYAITKLVMLSALSGFLSDILGFKLKLHKIKVK